MSTEMLSRTANSTEPSRADIMQALERPGTAPAVARIRPKKKHRQGYRPGTSKRFWVHSKVSLEIYYAILSEAKRTGKRTDQVAGAILRQWHADCMAADKAKKNPPG